MDLLNDVADSIRPVRFVIPLVAVFVLYFVFKKREELSQHAAQNTAATLMVYGANILVATLFLSDVNAFFQGLYNSLRIPTLPNGFWDGVPLLVICLVGMAAKDFVDYWNHRLMHTRWGWPTHAAHHSDTHVNAFTSYRVHILEAMLMSLGYIVVLTWMQMPSAIPFVVLFSALHNHYVHMDLPFKHGPFKYLLASPVFHRWHHADIPEAYGKNLANMMPIYDKLFGTYYEPDASPSDAPMGALKSGLADKNPVLIYIYPFQEWARLIREAATQLVGRSREAEGPGAAPTTPAE